LPWKIVTGTGFLLVLLSLHLCLQVWVVSYALCCIMFGTARTLTLVEMIQHQTQILQTLENAMLGFWNTLHDCPSQLFDLDCICLCVYHQEPIDASETRLENQILPQNAKSHFDAYSRVWNTENDSVIMHGTEFRFRTKSPSTWETFLF
jgi:hypothetical protein